MLKNIRRRLGQLRLRTTVTPRADSASRPRDSAATRTAPPARIIKIIIIGISGAGAHSIIHRETGEATGSDYEPWAMSYSAENLYRVGPFNIHGSRQEVFVTWELCRTWHYRSIEIEQKVFLADSPTPEQCIYHDHVVRSRLQEFDACVLVFSGSSLESLSTLEGLLGQHESAEMQPYKPWPRFKHTWLVANKWDLLVPETQTDLRSSLQIEGDEAKAMRQKGTDLAEDIGATFKVMSAKTGTGAGTLSREIAEAVVAEGSRPE